MSLDQSVDKSLKKALPILIEQGFLETLDFTVAWALLPEYLSTRARVPKLRRVITKLPIALLIRWYGVGTKQKLESLEPFL